MIRAVLIGAAALLLAGCSSRPDLDQQLGGPDPVLEEYFHGDLVAFGQFQDRSIALGPNPSQDAGHDFGRPGTGDRGAWQMIGNIGATTSQVQTVQHPLKVP